MTAVPWYRSRPVHVGPPPAKAALDRAVAGLLLLLSGACLLLVAFALWAVDDGPLLTRERRFGRGGREFDLLRFRTFPLAASTGPLGSAPAPDQAGTHPVGRLLRRCHLDLLPVLVNVVRGDLSLVGPRPRRVVDGKGLLAPHLQPGLVRPWRADAPPSTETEEVRALQRYHETWSVRTDLALLWRALRQGLPRPAA